MSNFSVMSNKFCHSSSTELLRLHIGSQHLIITLSFIIYIYYFFLLKTTKTSISSFWYNVNWMTRLEIMHLLYFRKSELYILWFFLLVHQHVEMETCFRAVFPLLSRCEQCCVVSSFKPWQQRGVNSWVMAAMASFH